MSEQGGHHVVQVMKYGVAGTMHEALASTGEVEWLDAAKMAALRPWASSALPLRAP